MRLCLLNRKSKTTFSTMTLAQGEKTSEEGYIEEREAIKEIMIANICKINVRIKKNPSVLRKEK